MSATCGVCTATTPDGVHLCGEHADRLLDALHAVPAVVEDLRTTFARQDQLRAPGGSVGKSTETPLPWNDRVPEKLDALDEALLRWARPVSRHLRLDALPHVPHTRDPKDPARVPAAVTESLLAARVLAEHLGVVRGLREAGDAYDEIVDAVTAARRVVDQPVTRKFLGICSAELVEGGLPCQNDLYAHPRRSMVRCAACGTTHDVEQRREVLLAAVHAQLVTYAEAERALPDLLGAPVKASTLRSWVSEGRLVPDGYRHAGTWVPTKVGFHDSPLLRVGDVVREYTRTAVGPIAA